MSTQRTVPLACIVPVYNEAEILPKAIPLLLKALRQITPNDFVIVIANNGSTDHTAEVAQQLVKTHPRVIRYENTPLQGRGQAFRHVLRTVKARQYIYIDVDLPCELTDLQNHLTALAAGKDLVISSRQGDRPLGRRVMTGGLKLLNRLFFRLQASDSQCAVKGLSPRAAKVMLTQCEQNGWFLDTELVVLCTQADLQVKEVPIHWLEERFPGRASKVDLIGDSWRCVKSLIQIRRHARELLDHKQDAEKE